MNNTSIHHNLHNHLVVFAHQRKQERVFTDEPQTPHCFRFSLRTCSSPQKLFCNKNRTRLPPLMFSHDNSKALNKQSDTNGKSESGGQTNTLHGRQEYEVLCIKCSCSVRQKSRQSSRIHHSSKNYVEFFRPSLKTLSIIIADEIGQCGGGGIPRHKFTIFVA